MLVEEDIVGTLVVIELSSDDYQSVLQRVANLGLASGSIYDALPTYALRAEGGSRSDPYLTYNVSHFERCQLRGIKVAVP